MNTPALASQIKNVFLRFEMGLNRALGRQFIPRDRTLFHIETSSACNLKYRFCAYIKKTTPTVSMSYETFADTVRQVLTTGAVNACACRNLDATQQVRNVQTEPGKQLHNPQTAQPQ